MEKKGNRENGDRKSIRNVVFDLDGTLTDTLPIIYEAFNHVVSPHSGRVHGDEEIHSYFGPPEEEILARFMPSENVGEGMSRLHTYYEENFHRVRLYEGLQGVMELLKKRGMGTALYTGKGRQGAEITLRQIGLDTFFDYTITGSDVENPKPHPEGGLKLIRLMKAEPSEVLMVGDSPADVEAGKGAGMKTALARWGRDTSDGLQVEPDYYLDKVDDLKALL